MTPDRDELVEKVARVLADGQGEHQEGVWRFYAKDATAAIDLIRAEVLEEAARVADDYEGKGMDGGYDSHLGDAFRTRRDIAAAIRALKGGAGPSVD